jgi:hypothetical protein
VIRRTIHGLILAQRDWTQITTRSYGLDLSAMLG